MPATDARLPDWHRAHGAPLFEGRIKAEVADFVVDERLGYELTGDGEHVFLRVEKSGANTAWVARQLGAFAGVSVRDVGYAGLKDRHAVTRQWFSVKMPVKQSRDWSTFEAEGVRILESIRHRRKLKRGAHEGNEFRITIRSESVPRSAVRDRIGLIASAGIPNYFGAQRFGRDAGNLELARSLATDNRLSRRDLGFALSAARSFLFNEILSRRVADGTWSDLLDGDVCNLDGTGSVFRVEEIDDALLARLAALDVHPTGAMWGEGDLTSSNVTASLEREIARKHNDLVSGLEQHRVSMARRALRCRVADIDVEFGDGVIEVGFALGRGCFATSVLLEIADIDVG